MVVVRGAVWLRVLAIGAVMLGMAGCSLNWPVTPDPAPPPEPVATDATDTPLEPVPPPMPDVPPEPEPDLDPVLPPVAIVLTGRHSAYADVADALAASLDEYAIYDLEDRSQPPVVVLGQINDSDAGAVVAIGLRAAQSSVAMSDRPVIFSQVFNIDDNGLVTTNSRGVSALPPLEPPLAAWKELDPSLSRIGLIIGEDHDALVAEASEAAEKHGVELVVRTSRSDQETLYLFRRMIRNLDGYWLFPDNRILSERVLGIMLEEARTRSVQVSTFNEGMLAMGATLSASPVASDIAATIVDVLERISTGGIESLPPLSPLSEVRIVSRDSGDKSADALKVARQE